jgi:hypothetical protein
MKIKNIVLIAFFSISSTAIKAQTPTVHTWGFEEFYQNGLDSGQVWDGSDGKKSIILDLPNFFNMELLTGWDTAWGGYWANNWILTAKDYTKEEPSNFMKHLYAVKPSVDNKNTGRVHALGTQNAYLLSDYKNGQIIKSFQVANTTYAYNSMKLGDNMGKKFTAADNDTFVLIIKGYNDDSLIEQQLIYLADFRLGINSYIANEWIDVNMIGMSDSIVFSLVSSDNGDFGMNQPAYFALDEITLIGPASVKKMPSQNVLVYPNPATDQLNFKNIPVSISKASCIDALGRKLELTLNPQGSANVSHLKSGIYWVELQDIKGVTYRSSFIKN